MAIIQISKIQQRSGNLVDLPQLDEAQFGWASDAKRLFIGKTNPNENIEVLTSYSNISFSQIDGSGGSNINVTSNALQDGQLLTYVSLTNTWENYTGNSSQIGNSKIQLGNVANIKMTGGATGYILETDGTGNLSWTPKGTLYVNIANLSIDTSNSFGILANAVVMRVANSTPFVNGAEITISGANGVSNSTINSQIFYVRLANDYPTSGNTILFLTSDLANANAFTSTTLTYTNAPNAVATSVISAGGGTGLPDGSTGTIQYNNGGTFGGSANFTITGGNTVSLTGTFSVSGNANVGNIGATGVVATTLSGSLITAAQPNITSTGTLASLSVSGNANIGNIGTAGLITATGNLNAGNIITTGVVTATGNITGGNLVTSGVVSASGNASVLGIKTDNYYYANGVSISFAGSYSNSNVSSFLASYGSNTISTTGNISGGNLITSSGKYLVNSVQTGISAAGSTQGTGTALANTVNVVSTVASGAGVVLPTAVAGMTVYITNTSANSLLVYPATGAVINELSTNAGYSQATKATIHYVAASSTQWYSVGATYA